MALKTCLVFVLALSLFLPAGAFAEKRIALVVTNQAYPDQIGKLVNPHRDGAAVKSALEKLGFAVRHVKDADQAALKQELAAYVGELSHAGRDAVGFLYYAGHGAAESTHGENYLIPVNAAIAVDTQLPLLGVKLGDIVRRKALEQRGPSS
jgi:uncharacterized caspase-like protein